MTNDNRRGCLRIVERLSDTTILMTWSDATRGKYVDQTWILTTAREEGVCAFTGMRIGLGDTVFKPRCTQMHRPTNHECRILAAAIQGFQCDPHIGS